MCDEGSLVERAIKRYPHEGEHIQKRNNKLISDRMIRQAGLAPVRQAQSGQTRESLLTGRPNETVSLVNLRLRLCRHSFRLRLSRYRNRRSKSFVIFKL
jgi:hypothetical protein